MTKVLLVVTSADRWTMKDGSDHPTGYWAAELTHPHKVFEAANFDITLATLGGTTPTLDEASLRLDFNNNDQQLIDEERKYIADLGQLLTEPTPLESVNGADFDVVFTVGGHGPMQDLAFSPVIGKLYVDIYADKNKVAAAICHGVAALIPANNPDGSWLFAGKSLTGFTNEEETLFGIADQAPWLLESRLRELGAVFNDGPAFAPNVVVDGNLITGQSPASGGPAAEAVVAFFNGGEK